MAKTPSNNRVVLAVYSADDLLLTTFGPFRNDETAYRWAEKHLQQLVDEADVQFAVVGVSNHQNQIDALFDLLGVGK